MMSSESNHSSHSILSYAEPDDPWYKRALIGILERFSGKPRLERMAVELLNRKLPPEKLMGAALEEMKIQFDMDENALIRIPAAGPLVLVANHPFGVVDGLALCEISSRLRKNYAILVNSVLCREPSLSSILLPVDFRETQQAMHCNLETRRQALERLMRGEAIAIFPSGAVATAPVPGKDPVDLGWKRFVVKLITKSNATVVPVYFHGRNSFWFQLASFIHMNLRLGLLLYEVRNKMGKPLTVTIGDPITPQEWQHLDPVKELLPFLREKTMSLGNNVILKPDLTVQPA